MNISSDADYIVYNLLKSLKIKFNKENLDRLLKEHPYYPSLASVKDTIEKYGISTDPVKIDISILEDETFPLISHLYYPKDSFILIEDYNKKKDTIKYQSMDTSVLIENIEVFNEKWSGIALRVKTNKQAQERHYYKNLLFNNFIAIFIFIIPLTAVFFSLIKLKGFRLDLFLIIPKISGLYVSWLITLKENLADNTWLSKICKASRFFDCEKVSKSKYRRIFNIINLSDLITAYFTFTIILFFAGINSDYHHEVLLTLYLSNIIGLPFIVYSLYVQYIKLKIFCPLCILTSLIFLIEFLVLIFNKNLTNFRFQYLFSYELLLSIGILGFVLHFKKILLKIWNNRINSMGQTHNWFMNIPGIIELALNNQKEAKLTNFKGNHIGIENAESSLKITLIVISDCLYCKDIANQINKFISQGNGAISIDLKFNSINEINTHLIAIFHTYGNYIKSWNAYVFYIEHGFDALKTKYPIENMILEKSKTINDGHVNWCTENGIFGAPFLYINNKLIPNILIHNNSIFEYLKNLVSRSNSNFK